MAFFCITGTDPDRCNITIACDSAGHVASVGMAPNEVVAALDYSGALSMDGYGDTAPIELNHRVDAFTVAYLVGAATFKPVDPITASGGTCSPGDSCFVAVERDALNGHRIHCKSTFEDWEFRLIPSERRGLFARIKWTQGVGGSTELYGADPPPCFCTMRPKYLSDGDAGGPNLPTYRAEWDHVQIDASQIGYNTDTSRRSVVLDRPIAFRQLYDVALSRVGTLIDQLDHDPANSNYESNAAGRYLHAETYDCGAAVAIPVPESFRVIGRTTGVVIPHCDLIVAETGCTLNLAPFLVFRSGAESIYVAAEITITGELDIRRNSSEPVVWDYRGTPVPLNFGSPGGVGPCQNVALVDHPDGYQFTEQLVAQVFDDVEGRWIACPRSVMWRGLMAPPPFGRSFPNRAVWPGTLDGSGNGTSCRGLWAVNGLVIENEPTNPEDHSDTASEYRGDVVLAIPGIGAETCVPS